MQQQVAAEVRLGHKVMQRLKVRAAGTVPK